MSYRGHRGGGGGRGYHGGNNNYQSSSGGSGGGGRGGGGRGGGGGGYNNYDNSNQAHYTRSYNRGGDGGGGRGHGGGYQQQYSFNESMSAGSSSNGGGSNDGGFRISISNFPPNTTEFDIMSFLRSACSESFAHTGFAPQGGTIVFYVNSERAANALKRLSGIDYHGCRLFINSGGGNYQSRQQRHVSFNPRVQRHEATGGGGGGAMGGQPSGPGLAPEVSEQLLQFMSSRFDPDSLLLNLTSLANDGGLPSANYVPLLNSIFTLIQGNCANIVTLILDDNGIRTLAPFVDLVDVAPAIANLSLRNNALHSVEELDNLTGLPVECLVLAGNPFVRRYANPAQYQQQVRQRFPTLRELDGATLGDAALASASASSSSASDAHLPEIRGSFYDSDAVQTFAMAFLHTYLRYFNDADANNRQYLGFAYSPSAVLSFAAASGMGHASNYNQFQQQGDHSHRQHTDSVFNGAHPQTGPSVFNYRDGSRNMQFVRDANRRNAALYVGRPAILQALLRFGFLVSESSLAVDAWSVSQASIAVSMHGVLSEGNDSAVRVFSRTLVITSLPNNADSAAHGWSGWITNDQWHFTNYTTQNTIDCGLPPSIGAEASLTSSFSAGSDPQTLILQLSRASGMNAAFSEQLLIQSNGDYSTALSSYLSMSANNQIPPEAYV